MVPDPPTASPVSTFEFSQTGAKLAGRSGILELMDDMGHTLAGDPEMRMLGGGNPASVPVFETLVRERMRELLADGDAFERMLLSNHC
jgi:valine--pyruvate aminotransferase